MEEFGMYERLNHIDYYDIHFYLVFASEGADATTSVADTTETDTSTTATEIDTSATTTTFEAPPTDDWVIFAGKTAHNNPTSGNEKYFPLSTLKLEIPEADNNPYNVQIVVNYYSEGSLNPKHSVGFKPGDAAAKGGNIFEITNPDGWAFESGYFYRIVVVVTGKMAAATHVYLYY